VAATGRVAFAAAAELDSEETLVRRVIIAIVAVAVTATAASQGQVSHAVPGFTMALTGDSIITRRLSMFTEPAHTRLFDLIRGADAAFTNLEMLFHDYEPYAMNESGGTYMRAEPALLKELVWAGFDIVSMANNHTGDYGADGMRITKRHVAAAGLTHGGVGEDLAAAREAAFLDTATARVAMISVASTFPDHSRAGRTRNGVRGRPGLNPLRFSTTYVVPRDRLEQLRSLQAELTGRDPAKGDAITFFGRRFAAGEKAEVRTEPNKDDLAEIAAVVRNAARLADYTFVTIHAHEGGANRSVPAQFLVTFARAMIEAGADFFVGHGPHVLRGIELYKGKPILYSLGDFIFQNETVLRLPSENYEAFDLGTDAGVADFNDRRYNNDTIGFPADREIWESVVAVPRWQGKRLVELALHPISLGFGKPRTERGRPMLADAGTARKILDDLTQRSAPFGTRIAVRDGIGYVELATASHHP
jgi:poly-gamma-glutamate capsule biosynthesis protein CapA/YwtB (metallophosphatase superfamily)